MRRKVLALALALALVLAFVALVSVFRNSLTIESHNQTPTPTSTPTPTLSPTPPENPISGTPPENRSTPPENPLSPTPTIPTTPTIPEPKITERQKQKIIADVIKKLDQGQISYNPPKEMEVGESDTIEVLVIASKTENISKYPSRGRGKPVIEPIRVSSVMQADLTGSKFDIKPLFSSKEKLVTEISPTSWQWEVTPKEAGKQRLTLTVTVNIEIPGYEKKIPPYEYKAFDRDIKVKVNPIYSITEFLKTNWQWVITTIIACFGGFPWIISNRGDIKRYICKVFQVIRISLKKSRRKLVKLGGSKKQSTSSLPSTTSASNQKKKRDP